MMRCPIQSAGRYFILFMGISFLGWIAETIFFLYCYGDFCDRGFLTLPFCTIYGFSFLFLYFLIGTPDAGGLLTIRSKGARKPLLIYFLLSALVPTGLELITGCFFHRVFGVRLWDYSTCRFHFHGYISLEYTLLWGVLIPICMKCVFIPLKTRVFALRMPYVWALAGPVALLTAMDWIINVYALGL